MCRSEFKFQSRTAIILPTVDCKYVNVKEKTVTHENKNVISFLEKDKTLSFLRSFFLTFAVKLGQLIIVNSLKVG